MVEAVEQGRAGEFTHNLPPGDHKPPPQLYTLMHNRYHVKAGEKPAAN